MTQDIAEKRIRALQKEFLMQIEAHPAFFVMPPDDFNKLRKRVFRGTFAAYRLGVVGLDRNDDPLLSFFAGWLAGLDTKLEPSMHMEIAEMCFRASLDAFRVGAMVTK